MFPTLAEMQDRAHARIFQIHCDSDARICFDLLEEVGAITSKSSSEFLHTLADIWSTAYIAVFTHHRRFSAYDTRDDAQKVAFMAVMQVVWEAASEA